MGIEVKRHLSTQISDSCVVGNYTQIGATTSLKGTVVGKNCTIGKNCKIENCIIWDNCKIGDGVSMLNCLICTGVTIDDSAKLLSGAMIDKDVHVKTNATIAEGTIASCLAITTSS
jgi:translation initiation factor eIF-2B subunit epsilon